MAPLTRSASTRATETGGPLQARAKPEPQVLWFGEPNADQDIRIRLVGKKVCNKENDDHTLALLMVHSSRLEKYSSYFSALLSSRWGSKRKRGLDEITLHVIGEVELYTDCFSRMYNPLEVGFKSVRYSLELLEVATQNAYDDLMRSICDYLESICPWTCYEELRIRKAVSSEAFPRGHAKDLVERVDGCLPRDDLRSLVTRCMKALHSRHLHFDYFRPLEDEELRHCVLETAKKQELGLVPTLEQEMATILNEEFKLLLVETNDEAEKEDVVNETTYNMWEIIEGDRGILGKLEAISETLLIMLATGTAVEAVKSFVKCRSFAKLVVHEILANENIFVAFFMVFFASNVVTILKEVLDGNLRLEDSDRDELFLNWVPELDQLNRTASKRATPLKLRYTAVRERLLSNQHCSQVLKFIVKN